MSQFVALPDGKHHPAAQQSSRSFKEIPLLQSGVQQGKERFENKQYEERPYIDTWRHNLTALSQFHNLYFVAYEDRIYTYQPSYPKQTLNDESVIILKLPILDPTAIGHMPNANPHSVNNLLVANLGEKEILLLACDDGHVIAYHTDSIQVAVARRSGRGRLDMSEIAEEVKPFFHVNVGKSAWGLAVHTDARLIAVSANTQLITIFAFGLTTEKHHVNDAADADQVSQTQQTLQKEDWPDITEALRRAMAGAKGTSYLYTHSSDFWFRTRNFKHSLRFHQANIPCIGFCNVRNDFDGIMLTSTDISGTTVLWDLRTCEPWKVLRPSSGDPNHDSTYDPERGGWGLTFIDPLAFERSETVKDALGSCYATFLEDVNAIDITPNTEHVRNADTWDISNAAAAPQDQEEEFDEDDDGDEDYDDDDEDNEIIQNWDYMNFTNNVATQHGEQISILSNGNPEVDYYIDHMNGNLEQRDDSSERTSKRARFESGPTPFGFAKNHRWSNLATSGGPIQMRLFTGVANPEHITFDMFVSDKSWHLNIFSFDFDRRFSAPREPPRIPFVLMNQRTMHMFQTPDFESRGRNSPVITIKNPLHQNVPVNIQSQMRAFDRLNYYHQIPELGVLMVGSPKGRVAVYTLHQLKDQPLDPKDTKPLFTMRLDHFLPFADQEAAKARPLHRLAGIAAGPVQVSNERSKTGRKWRVMLYYRDHTVLSYEIGRDSSGVLDTVSLIA